MSTITHNLSISHCHLRLARALRQGEATAIRGFFGRKFEEEVHMHNHLEDGTPVYQYPRVQYKVIDQTALLVGVNEGSELLQRLWLTIDETQIGSQKLDVLESSFETVSHVIELVDEPIEYEFATPWLGLNQKNHEIYVGLKNKSERVEKLAKTLAGNCLGVCKSLGIRRFEPHERIVADCSELSTIKTTLKGRRMLAFVGKFTLNLDLPNQIGLGKSVSRGFGTIEKL